MNKARRKWINNVFDKLQDLTLDLEQIRDKEQEAYDNLPKSLQYSENGEEMEENVSNLEDAISSLNEASDYLQEFI